MSMNQSVIRPALLLGALLLVGCAELPRSEAVAPVASTEPVMTASAEDDNAISCRRYDATGSRVRKEKVCMSNREWRQQEERAEELGEHFQSSGSTQPGGTVLLGGQ